MVSAKGITTTIMKTYIGRSVVSTGDIPGISYFSPYRRPVLSSTYNTVYQSSPENTLTTTQLITAFTLLLGQ